MTSMGACTGKGPIVLDPGATVGSDDTIEDAGGDTAPDTTDTDTTGPDTDDPTACSDLYDPSIVPDFEIEIDENEWEALVREYQANDGSKTYRPVVFRYDGEEVPDAMIRLKGNPAFSWFGDKMQFVISFNEVNPDARFHGQRKIALDASWYEPSQLEDRLAWTIMRGVEGLPATCANNATLTVNGQYYGVYTNIEYYDHEWQERNFDAEGAAGTLWKYGLYAKTNEDTADQAAIDRLWNTTDVTTLASLGDVTEWTKEWAAEAVLGDDDGYWCCDHNFYLYQHPTQGILFVPWDFDDAFMVQGYDTDPIRGYYPSLFQQPQYLAVVRDAGWRSVYVDSVAAVNAAMDPEVLLPEIDTWAGQIDTAVETDPHRTIGYEEHLQAIDKLKSWVSARHAWVSSWVACEHGETTDADGDGSPVCDDPDDTDPTVHPGATETCNGVDDDADGWVDDDASCDDCVRHDFDDRHFLFCRWPRSWTDARSACEARGGTLALPQTTPEFYMFYFRTWPVIEPWWLGATDATTEGSWVGMNGINVSGYWLSGEPDGGRSENCAAWEVGYNGWGSEDCATEHPSVCVIP